MGAIVLVSLLHMSRTRSPNRLAMWPFMPSGFVRFNSCRWQFRLKYSATILVLDTHWMEEFM